MKIYEIYSKNNFSENDIKQISKFSNSISERVKIFEKKGIHQWQQDYVERNSVEQIIYKLKNSKNIALLIFYDEISNDFIAGSFIKSSERPGYWDECVEDRILEKDFKLRNNKTSAYISGLVTNNKYKGTNLGATIINEIVKWCKNKDIQLLRLDCFVVDEKTDFLFNFYKKQGFRCVGRGCKKKQAPIVDYTYALFEGDVNNML